jgi:hypothetical protein
MSKIEPTRAMRLIQETVSDLRSQSQRDVMNGDDYLTTPLPQVEQHLETAFNMLLGIEHQRAQENTEQ